MDKKKNPANIDYDEIVKLKEMRKTKIIQYIVTFVIGICIATIYCITHKLALSENAVEVFTILCDASFISGILLILAFLLNLCSKLGAFDGIGYSVSLFFKVSMPSKREFKKEKYFDYVERKKAQRNKNRLFIIYNGVFFLLLSGIFYLIYNSLV